MTARHWTLASSLPVAALAASLIVAPAASASPGAAQAAVSCLRQDSPPAPPADGVVFARPLDPKSTAPNVLVADQTTAVASDCGGAAGDIMTHPTSITVAPGAAIVLQDSQAHLYSLWGAMDVRTGDPAPVFFYDEPDWKTTSTDVMTANDMLQTWGSCRSCQLIGATYVSRAPPVFNGYADYNDDLSGANMARGSLSGILQGWKLAGINLSGATVDSTQFYPEDLGIVLEDDDLSGAVLKGEFQDARLDGANLTGANLTGANLTGAQMEATLTGADLSGANLTDTYLTYAHLTGTNLSGLKLADTHLQAAVLDRTIVDHTSFDKTDLSGTHLIDLQYRQPPSFSGVQTGPWFTGLCTTFEDSDLVHVDLTFTADPGCETSPLLPGSSVSLGPVATYRDHPSANFADARLVVDGGDRSILAGKDLSGINLAGASFVGLPADLAGTNFDGASLKNTSFELADLSGATFNGANATGASFSDADLAAHGIVKGASFAGKDTVLADADFAGADLSGASFQGADLTTAVFDRALAVGTDFNSVRAQNAAFVGAHIYGDGQAFDNATDLHGADFSDAVLAGNVDQGGGFDLTHADLTGAKFNGAQCVACNFTGSVLDQVNFSRAYLPGAVLSNARLSGADLDQAWLYCGDLSNSSCAKVPGSQPRWAWPLALGSTEAYGPVSFATTSLQGVSLANVATCPDGRGGSTTNGCDGHLLPDPAHAPPLPAPCSAAALDDCPTPTSTIFDATAVGSPLAVAAANPPAWATTLTARGYYVSLADGTIRQVDDGAPRLVAGQPGKHCANPTDPCGDGGPAAQALLGAPTGLAVGLDGSVYLADPVDHRVRRIDPSGRITTVAGTGASCDAPGDACGDGGPATAARLNGPYGIWADPGGELFIADGHRGIRTVSPSGIIGTVPGTTAYDIRDVAGDASGQLYATTNDPDYLIKIDTASGQVTKVVGTGTSGYNGTTNSLGILLPGTSVQINQPEGIAVALNGDVLFADAGNNLVRAYVPSSGHVVELAGVVTNGKPAGGFNGDGHWADQTELNKPQDVTATRGALFVVADSGNGRVRQLGPSRVP
jgi:uncharacterized protein YjbI with pentapeptide repeats